MKILVETQCTQNLAEGYSLSFSSLKSTTQLARGLKQVRILGNYSKAALSWPFIENSGDEFANF